ncbi:hypothetical protein HZI73_22640 [Vallitalea pronyensis]|uniref:Uncharacterized protein n=1 Tax=Vallitalea pronyensis TaxID=1348613 RepID=A0A8J8SIX8_9FIRM|nr:hypothetical protein [Vallitalea pronyensis]QUI24912.1 hypothetical protein HZI73_22640 [Vallitalea pronyensis]
MEKYEEKVIKDNVLTEVYCNKCGKLIYDQHTKKKVDYLSLTKEWGYFSNKDMEIHSFDLCEECYDEFIESFKYPPSKTKK